MDGLRHELKFGVRHEDGEWVVPLQSLGQLEFKINGRGRAMRAQGIVELNGIVLPAIGDYELALFVNDAEIATHPLYVDLVPAT